VLSEKDRKIILHYARKYRAKRVILFGSSLHRSDPHDIDIAVAGIDPAKFFKFYWDVFSRLSKPVDIINLDRKSAFSRLIEKEGLRIYGKMARL